MKHGIVAVAIIALTGAGCSAGSGSAPSVPQTPTVPSSSQPATSKSTGAEPSESGSNSSTSVKPTPSAHPEKAAIRSAAQKYSDAYLTGDAKTAYAILSARCKKRLGKVQFSRLVKYADAMYGSKLPFKTFSAKIAGGMARVTYTYSVKAINQTNEPWLKEAGQWREDDC